MKMRPINENDLCEHVRYNSNVSGTHIYIQHGTSNEEKKDYSLYPLLSLMVDRGLFKKRQGESSKEAIERTAKEASNYVSEFTIQNNTRM